LRIFSTEADTEEDYYPREDGARRESSSAEKQKRYQEWVEKRISLAPSEERLSNEFRVRSGGHLPRGLLKVAKPPSTEPIKRTRMLSRVRKNSEPLLQNPINPSDLLRTQEPSESDESIFTAIETCISSAIDRLELYRPDGGSGSRPSEPITIPHDQYMWLCHILQFQFAKSQLVMYGHRCGIVKSHLQREKTTDVIKAILDKVWNLDKEPELPPDEALVTKSKTF
jgi:hypothetical protein